MAARKAKKTTKKAQSKSRASGTRSASAKSSAKKAPASRTSAKKTTAKKATSKAAAAKKTTAKRAATKKAATKKTTAKKAASKKATTKKKATTTKATPGAKTRTNRSSKKATASKKTSTAKRSTSKSSTKARSTKKAASKKTSKAAKSAKKTTARKTATKRTAQAKQPATRSAAASPTTRSSKSRVTGSATPTTKAAKAAPEVPEVPKGPPALADQPTEELWILYRKHAGKPGKADQEKLEELRNILIERHYPLVRYIAERLLQTLPKSIELDDLISAGNFGLMDAIRGFDPYRGIKFKTYCSTRVRGAILDQLRSQDWVPRLVRLKASRIEKALQRLTAEYGREPTHAELAKTLEMDHTELSKEIQESRAKTMFSLSEKWEDDDGSVEKVEVLEDKTAIDPVHELNRRDLMTFITRSLTHKERFIIEQYYQYGHTMREIGEMLALTESRVCQIHSNVMSRLKGLLGQRAGVLLGG